ncbi:hypothetical protein AOQ84DRAFT_357666, partial [Glonium stellatum]
MENMGNLYGEQGGFTKAQEMYTRALLGCQTVFRPSGNRCQSIRDKLNALSRCQGTNNSAELPVKAEVFKITSINIQI